MHAVFTAILLYQGNDTRSTKELRFFKHLLLFTAESVWKTFGFSFSAEKVELRYIKDEHFLCNTINSTGIESRTLYLHVDSLQTFDSRDLLWLILFWSHQRAFIVYKFMVVIVDFAHETNVFCLFDILAKCHLLLPNSVPWLNWPWILRL